MTDHNATTNVVVIGGGYAGATAANHLRMGAGLNITLVNPRPKFVERIRLHQLVAGTSEATADYGTLLGEGIQLVVDNATRIDTASRTVQLASGRALDYDYVIYAVGSTGTTPAAVPGAAEFAYPVAEFELAKKLRAKLDELHPDAPVTVVGAGLTGTETAAELAEQGRKVTLVCGGMLVPTLSEPGRRSIAKWLAKHGVAVLEDDVVAEVRPDAVVFADGAVRPSAVTVWTAGFGVPELAAEQRAAHRRAGPVAHRRDADQRRRSAHRGRGRRRSTIGPAAADELPSGGAAGCAGRQHRAEPHRRQRAGRPRSGVRGILRQPGPSRRHHPVRPQGRHGGELLPRWPAGCLGEGGDLQGHAVGDPTRGPQARLHVRVKGRPATVAASIRHRGGHGIVTTSEHAERFTHLRPLLFTIVYEILGSATESDDVLQDSYLRWAEVDLTTVRDTKSYLAQLVTRQALNALRAGARRREDYIGPWLPEPLLLDDRDASADVVLAESVSMAMLVLLETLTPDERAVFVLREVFGFDYDEIAGAVGKSVATVRQVAHRAREHVQARRKRFEPVDAATTTQITEQFMTAATTGDMEGLLSMLAPDATWTADSGGKATAARRPIIGAKKVANVIIGLFRFGAACRTSGSSRSNCNNAPAMVVYSGDRLEGVFTDRDHRRQDRQLLRHAQPGQAGRDRLPAADQPVVMWVTIADVLSQAGRRRDLKGMTDHNATARPQGRRHRWRLRRHPGGQPSAA